MTLLLLVAARVKLVVERELGACRDVSVGEESDARVAVDAPLLRVAVRVATVVHEATQVALRTSVDHSATCNDNIISKIRSQK